MDTGDYIVIINAEKIRVTGNKAQNKMYYRYSGYIGGLKQINFEKLLAKAPEQIIERAVKGMLPKGPLGRDMYRKLKVFSGPQHDHTAQQPIPLEI
jgi:large subunit ribosomal protein L13